MNEKKIIASIDLEANGNYADARTADCSQRKKIRVQEEDNGS